jgi:hypothetical protein
MPLKMPVLLLFEITPPSVKFVAVVMFPVGSAVTGPRLTKPWLLGIGVAWPTAVAGDRQIATADSIEVHIKLRLT